MKSCLFGLKFDFKASTLPHLYTSDVVSSCAFGLTTNTASGEENVFMKYAKIMMEDGGGKGFSMFIIRFMPTLARLLRL